MNAIYRNASRHFDVRAKVEFTRFLLGGSFVGVAYGLTDEQVEALTGREGFELYSDEELQELVEAEALPTPAPTGNAITDAANQLPTDYKELLKLAAARGITFEKKQPSKVEVITALSASTEELPAPPPPPGS